ncbi:hypothetical protein AABD61_12965 [Edwardsiella piscicida]|uniref:hypothetical protein n=1 Tax=Edwardsiella piscicida TaxID=1263550 RepID=UPI00370D88AE
MNKRKYVFLLFFIFPICAFGADGAEDSVPVFTTPWSRLFSGSEARLSTAITYNAPLSNQEKYIPVSYTESETKNIYNQRVFVSFQYSPLSSFFANLTVRTPLQNINRYRADFVYSFGYDDWRPGTFSLVYSNYGDNNKFFPQEGDRRTKIEQGMITAAYKFSLPNSWNKNILIYPSDSLTCQIGYLYGPRYYSTQESRIRKGKSVLLGSCGYTLKHNYFFRVSTFFYPDRSQQQPWDADYTYSIGYVSGYQPGDLSISYSNYSGTRYFWRGDRNANFRDGTISITWTLPF